jgi:hypothetical protein
MEEPKTTDKPIRGFFNNPKGDAIKEFDYFKQNGRVSVWSHFVFDFLKQTLKIEFSQKQKETLVIDCAKDWQKYVGVLKNNHEEMFYLFLNSKPNDNRTLYNLMQRKALFMYFEKLKSENKELKQLLNVQT